MNLDRRGRCKGLRNTVMLSLTSLPPGWDTAFRLTWPRGMQDGQQQGPGAEGFPAHVGKDRDTEAAQDEAGIEQTAQDLQTDRQSRTHGFGRHRANSPRPADRAGHTALARPLPPPQPPLLLSLCESQLAIFYSIF